MQKKFRDRLLILAAHMERVKPSRFYMPFWFKPDAIADLQKVPTKLVGGRQIAILPEGFCQTPACVLGSAATIPEFNRSGLNVDLTRDLVQNYGAGIIFITRDDTHYEIDAGREFFGLNGNAAQLLFFYGDYQDKSVRFYLNEDAHGDLTRDDVAKIKPKHVAAALYKFIATDGRSADPYLSI